MSEPINTRLNAIQRRIDFDLLNRSLPGILIYPIFWPLIFFSVGFHVEHPSISWGVTIITIAISLLRLFHYYISQWLYSISRNYWLMILLSLTLLQAAIWGMLLFLSITQTDFLPVKFMLVLVIGGISSATLHALVPRFSLAVINTIVILIPAVMSLLFMQNNYLIAILLIIYFAYLLITGKRLNKEYIRSYQVEMELESSKQEVQRQSQIDPLTGIYNRGRFNSYFELQWNNALRNQSQLSLLMIDIDHFKQFNDQFGHLVGDQCLIYVASTILKNIKRKTDLVARFGGEEFVVLLSDTSSKEALHIAEKIRKAIVEASFTYEDMSLKVQASIGVASLVPQKSNKEMELIDRADKALYQAKSAGRNSVRLFQDNG